MSDPSDLAAFWALAWQRLARIREVVFATVSPGGMPQARMVVLRHARQDAGVLDIHTDPTTAKIEALETTPFAELHAWDKDARLQIRALCRIAVLTGPQVDADWCAVPDPARQSYGTQPVPGTPIAGPHDYEKPARRSGFAVLRCHIERVDLVELHDRHRRAEFARADNWAGQWVSP